jgi:2-polyprenyl-3-methyl-5-hydroxy-6-metoxy-1,4-benzoquinol methylase
MRKRIGKARSFLRGMVLDFGCGSGELAELVPCDQYVGFDINKVSIARCRSKYPNHRFTDTEPFSPGAFDTIVALAVIEHVPDPAAFLVSLGRKLLPGGRIILTTPHPSMGWAHKMGSYMGLFSSHAAEEHETLLARGHLQKMAMSACLCIMHYERFLWGANQFIVLGHKS